MIYSMGSAGAKFIKKIVLSAPGATFDFTGLDISNFNVYKIFLYADNNTANPSVVSLYANGDTTATNYYAQVMYGNGAGVGAQRYNNASIGTMQGSKPLMSDITIVKTPDGYIYYYSGGCENSGANVLSTLWIVSKVAAATNITQLTISSAENMKTGSTAILYAFP